MEILECTLRDGSYAIDFQFTAEDTYNISGALDQLGFKYIEIGHGLGVGASRLAGRTAAETDEAYMDAANEAVKKNQWGMFCIPGIAGLHDLDASIDKKMGFIRIGTNIDSSGDGIPFIEKAKKAGMFVAANFMKSYASSPKVFAQKADEVTKAGADIVYVVDSAGGMLPQEIKEFFDVSREVNPDINLGFHGHNNLGMAVANSLYAAELGAKIVDTSLQGFGRSAGNASTEQLVCALMRRGIDCDIDPISLMEAGEKFIHPLIRKIGLNSVDMTSGLALFHSSYLPQVIDAAKEHRVDVRRLIVAVCRKNKADAPRELIEEQAIMLQQQGVKSSWKPLYSHYYGNEQN